MKVGGLELREVSNSKPNARAGRGIPGHFIQPLAHAGNPSVLLDAQPLA